MKVLIIGFVWPEPASSAAGLRTMSLLRIFREAGWDVTFACGASGGGRASSLEGVRTVTVKPNEPGFDRFIAELSPDFCIFDRFPIEEQFGWRVAEHSPRTVRVLDTVDIHSLRRSREAEHLSGLPLEDSSPDFCREVASIYRSDLTLIISDFELEWLVSRFSVPRELLRLFRFCYDPAPLGRNYDEREHFSVIGNFRHAPNADGVRWLHEAIWPRIRRALPRAEVHVYGAYPPREISALDDAESGFRVRGSAHDQYATLARYRVNLAPLRFGAGIKGKISDGWWCGAPAVTTPVGAEGMSDAAGWGGIVASGPDAFADAAIALYTDHVAWNDARANGRRLLASLFDHSVNAKRLMDDLLEVRGELESARSRNFTGAMLRHHTMASTRHLSRWIELKNSSAPVLSV